MKVGNNMTELNYTLTKQLKALLEDETDFVANLSNASALLYHTLEDINWAGFYLWNDQESQLILGPFQGLVACNRIDSGSGVCGTAFETKETQLVPDVHQFPGHIACDSASNSEIVVPLYKQDQLIGVLDIDSPKYDRFSEVDQQLIEEYAQVLNQNL